MILGGGPAPLTRLGGWGWLRPRGAQFRCTFLCTDSGPGTDPGRPESAARARIVVLYNPASGLATLKIDRTYIRSLYTVTAF